EKHALGTAPRANRRQTPLANPVVHRPPGHTEQLRRMVQQHASTLKISAVRSDRGFRRVHQHPLKQKPECDGATGTVNATAGSRFDRVSMYDLDASGNLILPWVVASH